MPGALDNIKIIDTTTTIAGPLAMRILADYGADVTKVESLEGDPLRRTGPNPPPRLGAIFLQLNRNKRALAIDLKSEEGKEIMHRLLAEADVFAHNMRPDALERLGLDYEACRKINPRIIHAGVVGFDHRGPRRNAPAYDDLIQAMSGLASLLGTSTGSDPTYVPLNLADRFAGTTAAHAVLAAVVHQIRTGEGQRVEIPMYEALAEFVLGDHLWKRTFSSEPEGLGHPRSLSPHRKPYKTKDGYIAVVPYIDKQWHAIFRLIGREEFVDDQRYTSMQGRAENIGTVMKTLSDGLAQRTTAEWLRLLKEADIPCGPANNLTDLFDDAQLKAVNFFQTEQHPTEGEITVPRPAVWMSRTNPELKSPCPPLGQNTESILSELGYSGLDIEQLRARRVI